MTIQRANHDATVSTRATIYQICVGLMKCYDMLAGQKLSIEALGDVTILGDKQVEVKNYQDKLTDGHPNFWKTLKNWLDDTYDSEPYSALVLHTTQLFAEGSRLVGWNDATTQERLDLLDAIHADFVKRNEAAVAKGKKSSQVFKLQQYVLDSKRQDKLRSVVGKYVIETGCLEMSALYQEIMDTKTPGIPKAKKEDYLNALLGFVFSPQNESDERWEISFEGFHERLEILTDTFRRETRVFPKKAIIEAEGLARDQLPTADDALFIKKINEIGYGEDIIYRAKRDHFGALNTINQVFADHSIPKERVEGFVGNVLAKFEPLYRSASRNCVDVIPESQDFYDERHADDPPDFDGYDGVDYQFRNGVLHMQMDLEYQKLKWRLK